MQTLNTFFTLKEKRFGIIAAILLLLDCCNLFSVNLPISQDFKIHLFYFPILLFGLLIGFKLFEKLLNRIKERIDQKSE